MIYLPIGQIKLLQQMFFELISLNVDWSGL